MSCNIWVDASSSPTSMQRQPLSLPQPHLCCCGAVTGMRASHLQVLLAAMGRAQSVYVFAGPFFGCVGGAGSASVLCPALCLPALPGRGDGHAQLAYSSSAWPDLLTCHALGQLLAGCASGATWYRTPTASLCRSIGCIQCTVVMLHTNSITIYAALQHLASTARLHLASELSARR